MCGWHVGSVCQHGVFGCVWADWSFDVFGWFGVSWSGVGVFELLSWGDGLVWWFRLLAWVGVSAWRMLSWCVEMVSWLGVMFDLYWAARQV